MQIVIDTNRCPCRTDISECKCTNEDCFIDDISHMCPLTKNGTVLPENHGDLVDRIEIEVEEDVYNQTYIIHAPTILEATGGKK